MKIFYTVKRDPEQLHDGFWVSYRIKITEWGASRVVSQSDQRVINNLIPFLDFTSYAALGRLLISEGVQQDLRK